MKRYFEGENLVGCTAHNAETNEPTITRKYVVELYAYLPAGALLSTLVATLKGIGFLVERRDGRAVDFDRRRGSNILYCTSTFYEGWKGGGRWLAPPDEVFTSRQRNKPDTQEMFPCMLIPNPTGRQSHSNGDEPWYTTRPTCV